MDVGLVHSIFTVVLLVLLVNIFIWAFSKSQQKRFEAAAQLVFADEATSKQTMMLKKREDQL